MLPEQFSLEHIPRSLSPTGRLDSAPKAFAVFGLRTEHDQNPVRLGSYEYDAVGGPSLQFFPVEKETLVATVEPFQLVELEITSNHGHPEYTCLYRFRVHGRKP